MYVGTNMKKLLNSVKRERDWVRVSDDPAKQKTATSLVNAGLLQARTRNGNVVSVIYRKDAAGNIEVKRVRAVNPESKFQQALSYARKHPKVARPKLVGYLQDRLEMTPAGANTYATAVLQQAHATVH